MIALFNVIGQIATGAGVCTGFAAVRHAGRVLPALRQAPDKSEDADQPHAAGGK